MRLRSGSVTRRRGIPASLLCGPNGVESGPQPFSASSDRYYFVGVEENVIQKSYDTSGSSGDALRQDNDDVFHSLNGSSVTFEDFASANRPEMRWLYNMNQGAGLTANTALFLGSVVTGGNVGANPACIDCCPTYWCDCDFRYCYLPEECLSVPTLPIEEGDPPDCPEECEVCWEGCGDDLRDDCPFLFRTLPSDVYFKWYTGGTRSVCTEDQAEEWKPRCQGNETGYEGCCHIAVGRVPAPKVAPFTAAKAEGGCCPGCVAGGDDCCTQEGTMSGCGCGNGGGDNVGSELDGGGQGSKKRSSSLITPAPDSSGNIIDIDVDSQIPIINLPPLPGLPHIRPCSRSEREEIREAVDKSCELIQEGCCPSANHAEACCCLQNLCSSGTAGLYGNFKCATCSIFEPGQAATRCPSGPFSQNIFPSSTTTYLCVNFFTSFSKSYLVKTVLHEMVHWCQSCYKRKAYKSSSETIACHVARTCVNPLNTPGLKPHPECDSTPPLVYV